MLLRSRVHVLCSLAIVACTFHMCDIRYPSSRQAEQASHPVTHAVPSAVNIACRILVLLTFFIAAPFAIKRICVYKGLLQSSAARLYDLDWISFSSTRSHLFLLCLHLLLQLGPWRWGDENGRLPEGAQPVVLLPPLGQPASGHVPALGARGRRCLFF